VTGDESEALLPPGTQELRPEQEEETERHHQNGATGATHEGDRPAVLARHGGHGDDDRNPGQYDQDDQRDEKSLLHVAATIALTTAGVPSPGGVVNPPR